MRHKNGLIHHFTIALILTLEFTFCPYIFFLELLNLAFHFEHFEIVKSRMLSYILFYYYILLFVIHILIIFISNIYNL